METDSAANGDLSGNAGATQIATGSQQISSGVQSFSDFGKLSFSRSQIDRLPLGSYSSQLTKDDLYDSTLTTLEVSTGKIASNGQSFKTTFVAP